MEVKTVRLTNHQLGFKPKRNHVYNLIILMTALFAHLSWDFSLKSDYKALLVCFIIFTLLFALFLTFEMARMMYQNTYSLSIFESKYDKDGKTRKDKVCEFWENVKRTDENIIVTLTKISDQAYRKTIRSKDTQQIQNELKLAWGNITLYCVDSNKKEISLEGLPSYFKNTRFEEGR